MSSTFFMLVTQEVKTTWHPLPLIERGQGGGGGY